MEHGNEQLDISAAPQQPSSAAGLLTVTQSPPDAANAGATPGAAAITVNAISGARNFPSVMSVGQDITQSGSVFRETLSRRPSSKEA